MSATAPHPPNLAPRMAQIRPFFVMEVQRRAFELDASGRDVVHLEIGQPDFGAPEPVVEAVTRAARTNPLGYTDALGLPVLREKIARYYLDTFGASVTPDRIMVTAGASGAFMTLSAALFGPRDEILLPAPGYPCNRHFVAMFEASPRTLLTAAENRFQPRARDVEAAWSDAVKGIVIASPANPTGATIACDELAAITQFATRRRGHVIVDEIYQGLSHDGPARTALAISDQVFIVNSFSKYFGMTGWRLGWIVADPGYIKAFERFAQNAYICPPTPAQYAALAALSSESLAICESRREEFRRRRDFVVPALKALGFGIPVVPDGAFYVYADCSRFTRDSFRFAFDVLEHAQVALTPGADFGGTEPEKFVRIAYTRPIPALEEGIRRLQRFLAA